MRNSILGPRRDVASPEQVRSLRERQRWTVEELADAVGASPLEVAVWEAGTVQVPPEQALRIHWQAEVAGLAEAVAAALDRPCPWVRENAPDLYAQVFATPNNPWDAGNGAVRAHVGGCDRCKEVLDQARRIGGFPEEPDTSGSLDARYFLWVERLPRWARGPFGWLGLIAPIVGVWLLLFGGDRDGWSLGVLFGFIACFVATFTLSRVTRRPIAALLNGLAAGIGGLLGWAVGDASVDLGDPLPWAVALAVGLGVGLLMLWGERAARRSEAKALAAGIEPEPLLPELAVLMQCRDPAVIRALADEWRARHVLPPGAAGPEPVGSRTP
jgi:transcriptional regulator with XRE-family HTH domain